MFGIYGGCPRGVMVKAMTLGKAHRYYALIMSKRANTVISNQGFFI